MKTKLLKCILVPCFGMFFLMLSLNAQTSDEERLLNACKGSNIEYVTRLLNSGIDVNATDSKGWTPLHYAAMYRDVRMLETLISAGAKVDVFTQHRWTPLHLVARYQSTEMVRALLKAGATVSVFNDENWTPLHMAAAYQDVEMVKTLLQAGARVNFPNHQHFTALHLAARYSNSEMVKVLLFAGAKVNISNIYKWTPLHFAAGYNSGETIQVLLNEGANINAKNNEWQTPLDVAKKEYRYDATNILSKALQESQNAQSGNNRKDESAGQQKTESANTLTDIDGNVYQTITLGNQTWMAENLKTTRYSNGTMIPHLPGENEWYYLGPMNRGYCYYDNDTSNLNTYGALYTWAAAMDLEPASTSSPSGVQGVCPSDWHLPSVAEWIELKNFLAENGYSIGSIEGEANVAKAMAGTRLWNSSEKAGTPGSTEYSEYQNKSGFNALPSAGRLIYYNSLGEEASWWSTDKVGTDQAIVFKIHNIITEPFTLWVDRNRGYPVRCVKD